MSYELIAILVVGATTSIALVATIVIMVSGFGALVREMNHRFAELTREMNHRFEELTREMNGRFEELTREMDRSFAEITRTNRVVASLVVQESDKIQALLRP